MIEYAGEFYFTAASRDHVGDVRYGLYRTDVDEVHLVFPSEGPIRGPHPKPLGVISNSLFVSAAGPHGYELMRIKLNDMEWIDLNPEGDSSPTTYTEFNGDLFIRANAPVLSLEFV